MPDIRKDIERIINSEIIDCSELSRITDVLKAEGRYNDIDLFTKRLLERHTDDSALLLRAWYLTDIEGRYKEASDILRTIGNSNDVMFALLRAEIILRTTFDADSADDILEEFIRNNKYSSPDISLEAARMFITGQFTDLAEKWIMLYDGVKDTDYMMVYGNIAIAREDYDTAADIFRIITRTEPHNTDAWIYLSDVLINMKDYEAAADAAHHALNNDKDNRKANENIRLCNICLYRHNNKK